MAGKYSYSTWHLVDLLDRISSLLSVTNQATWANPSRAQEVGRECKSSMGFRFNNFTPIYKTCVTRLSSHAYQKFPTPLVGSPNFHQSESSLIYSNNPVFKITRRWHLGHSHGDHENQHLLLRKEGENIFRLGLAADIGLAAGKAMVGYLSGSTAIIADAAHSISDVVFANSFFFPSIIWHSLWIVLYAFPIITSVFYATGSKWRIFVVF